jgi:hypothetical protein
MTTHELKTDPKPFQAIIDNRKPWELRLNDRDFKEGDLLHLREYEHPKAAIMPALAGGYTGRDLWKTVTFILYDSSGYGIPAGYCLMTLGKMHVGADTNPNPWVPMDDPKDIKHLGKMMEELGELTSAAARCLIQGIDETEPSSGKTNRQWLQEEISDVHATSFLTTQRFELNTTEITARANRKIDHLRKWFAMMAS